MKWYSKTTEALLTTHAKEENEGEGERDFTKIQ
jgi:hypothetical protein